MALMPLSTIHVNATDLKKALYQAKDGKDLNTVIVNLPFRYKIEMALLFLGIVALLIVDEKKQTINRVALSDTERASGTISMSAKRFEDIKVPLSNNENLIAKAIRSGKPQSTTDWQYLFVPELTAEEARLNQSNGKISLSCVYPLEDSNTRGALIYSYYFFQGPLKPLQRRFMKLYTKLVSERLDDAFS